MHAEILKDFFLSRASASELSRDLEAAFVPAGLRSLRFVWEDLNDDFEVHAEHLISLLDAVLAGEIEPTKLEAVGACLSMSKHFAWAEASVSGGLVDRTVSDWIDPEINFDLNLETAAKFRHRLLTGEDLFTPGDWWTSVHRPA